ncbi:LacI family DNA-binding transcriptional regulator [Mycobacterium sp. ACS4331]|uniref:LacI family DNA-binding transcriptional regulator n=1 Tax=Mycobacterium sp. ACS4331 TaxID=1834121 RepID=UPI0007FD4D15|nr:LacI family DNA-binding transcriptional regulator [Mycobacterium sp. ACS4331]OBF23859.1 LacI family transcriptional regulator [Mycobacterium sp. ACS4331]
MSSHRPTKADVARLANVSTATVSYVLNDVAGRSISERTREAVRRAADELGYRPNLAARNLARGASGVVLYVVPRVALGELAMEVGSRMTTALARHGVLQILQFETEDDSLLVDAIADLNPVAVTSLFPLTGPALEAVRAAGIPHIHLGSAELNALGDLHLAVGELRVDHLTARGHRRLAFAYTGVSRWLPLGDYWLTGTTEATRRRGLPDPVVGSVRAETAATVVAEWHRVGITAVCAQSDETAFVVLHGVRLAGLRCPDDLAVMGVDATPTAEVSSPPLTTVGFDAGAIVDVAVAAMLSELGYPGVVQRVDVPIASVITREST